MSSRKRPRCLNAKPWVGVCVGGLCVFHVASARANDPLRIQLFYTAPAACPDRKDFAQEVRRRTQAVQWSEEGTAVTLTISILEGAPGGFVAKVEVIHSRGRWSRAIEASSCVDVVDAAGLVVAMAFDVRARADLALPREQRSVPPPPPESESTADAAPAADVRPAVEAAPAADVRPAVDAPPSVDVSAAVDASPVVPLLVAQPPPSAEPSAATPRWAWLGGTGVRWRSALGSALRPEIAAWVEARRSRLGWFAPALRLSLFYTSSGRLRTSAGSAMLEYGGGRWQACSSQVAAGPLVWRGLCAELEFGVVVGSSEIDLPRPQTRPWFAVETGTSLAWHAGRFWVGMSGRVGAIPQGYRFQFSSPLVTVHELQGAYGAMGLDVSWQFL